ncbi:TolC family protein [Uliginosibacterium sediminicola]|uniref:TolC family protein n=1 Tax=Uliginosibacterium sediminicola TaxID=2024550 RepID=A0ABU9YYN5_9RHOO
MKKNVPPLGAVLSLEEAIARAIKFNAERRYRIMEEALAQGNLDVGSYDLLPKLVASAGYRERDNDQISRSKDSVTGAPSLANPFISSSRSAMTSDLSLSWSLLDFGQSYYAAKQNADRVLIAQERKRKALQLLVQDVRTAYWRVVAAQSLSEVVTQGIRDAESALQDARQIEREGLRNPLEPLRFQRQVLENIRLLETVQQELSTAKAELASLINVPLSSSIKVQAPAAELQKAWLQQPIGNLEEHALIRNADLREGMYNSRIASLETRRALLKLFPGLSFSYAMKQSDDSYLINQSWNEAGLQISFNLFNLLSAPAQMRLSEAGVALADQKRLVTQMAVLSQLHIARLQYANAIQQFERADEIAKIESRMTEHSKNQAEAEKQSKLDRVSQSTSYVLAQLRRYQALSNAQSAASKLQASLGLEPVVEAPADSSLGDLTTAVTKALAAWQLGELPDAKQAATATAR